MAEKLDELSLRDVLVALKKVNKPYQLGTQLKIDSSELDNIEKNYPRDIDRQKTEVVIVNESHDIPHTFNELYTYHSTHSINHPNDQRKIIGHLALNRIQLMSCSRKDLKKWIKC